MQAMMEEIHRLGAWVTNPQPLQDDRCGSRSWTTSESRSWRSLASWDWSPRPCCAGSRFIPTGNGAMLQPTTLYEIDVSREEEAPKPHGAEVISSGRVAQVAGRL